MDGLHMTGTSGFTEQGGTVYGNKREDELQDGEG